MILRVEWLVASETYVCYCFCSPTTPSDEGPMLFKHIKYLCVGKVPHILQNPLFDVFGWGFGLIWASLWEVWALVSWFFR